MFLNLVRQRTKNICSASNDQGENPQNPAKTRKKPAKNRKNPQILKSRCFGNFRIFLSSKISSRFVYMGVVLRFSQKHTCLEQSESFFRSFDLSS